MKKILTILVLLALTAVCLSAQNTNKYVVKLKNGIDVECVSYKLTEDNNIQVTYADGSTVSIMMSDVEKISPLEKTAVTEKTTQAPARQVQQTQATAGVAYANPQSVVYAKPPKSPALAGVLSFVIPGVGQFYNGDVGAGIGFLLGNMVSYSLAVSAANAGNPELTLIFLGTTIGIDIWAIVHAVRGAKRVNAQNGFALGNGQYFDLQPAVMTAPAYAQNKHSATYGLSFGLRF